MKTLLYGKESLHPKAILELQAKIQMIPVQDLIEGEAQLTELMNKYPEAEGIAMSPPLTKQLIRLTQKTPVNVRRLKCADFLMFENKSAWPVLILPSSIRSSLVKKIPRLDSTKVVYILGHGKLAEIFAWTILDMGFKHIKWIFSEDDMVSEQLEQMKDHFLGSQIDVLNINRLSQQPTDGIILLSVLNPEDSKALLDHVGYFNYLGKNSVMVEYSSSLDPDPDHGHADGHADRPGSALWEAAQAAGLYCISRADIDEESANQILR
ncbi:MAG: hypothetical protein ACK5P5_00720 [Pseudobdellovibrionaceae bacterium]